MRYLVILACLLVPLSAFGATTWTTPASLVSKAACTTGSETGTPPSTDSDGLALSRLSGFVVHVEAGSAMTAGSLAAYLWNPVTDQWNRAPELDITVVGGGSSEASSGFAVTSPRSGSRIAYLPDGLGVAVDVYIVATR